MAEKKYDVIVVGAGHNGLILGNYLTKAGLKVLVIERRLEVGGEESFRAWHRIRSFQRY